MARTKQKFRKTPKGGHPGIGKLQHNNAHQGNPQNDNDSNEKVQEKDNTESAMVIDSEKISQEIPRAKIRLSSITAATSGISLNEQKGEKKHKQQHNKTDKLKSQAVQPQNNNNSQRISIKPPVTLATNKPQSSSQPTVPTNANQGAYVNDRTVYVEGLPFGSNEGEVRTFFGECGKILSVRLPTWHDTGRLKGYGHIEFASNEAATQAFNLDGKDFFFIIC